MFGFHTLWERFLATLALFIVGDTNPGEYWVRSDELSTSRIGGENILVAYVPQLSITRCFPVEVVVKRGKKALVRVLPDRPSGGLVPIDSIISSEHGPLIEMRGRLHKVDIVSREAGGMARIRVGEAVES